MLSLVKAHRLALQLIGGYFIVFTLAWTIALAAATVYYVHVHDWESLKSWWSVGALGYPFFVLVHFFIKFMLSVNKDELEAAADRRRRTNSLRR